MTELLKYCNDTQNYPVAESKIELIHIIDEAVAVALQSRDYRRASDMFAVSQMDARYEGRLEGRLEGKLEGKLEGRLEGKLEGNLEGKLESARGMRDFGISLEDIALILKLPPDVLKRELQLV
ncbi:MAG: hypothetical protein LBD16_06870 [Oscillospiraceae bacterium]|nr:hypothetical protein [Oscillospiraceae bacterium]